MTPLTPSRVDAEELLDEHDAPYDAMTRSLRDLRRINRYLGGTSIYRRLLARFVGSSLRGMSILDLGSGTSDLPASLRGSGPRAFAIDFKIDHLLYGRSLDGHEVRRTAADAFSLPFADGRIDVVTSAHFFHHFSPEQNQRLLTEALRVSRIGVVVNDTRRHWIPLLTTRLLGALRLVGEITRFDAPASVLRGYTTREVREMAAHLPAARAEVVNVFPFRFGLLLWK